MSKEIKRATGLLVIEVVNSNPNGDPDRESDPRQRPNGCGEISPVSFKRKLRDLLDDHDAPFFKALPEKFSGNAERYSIWSIADEIENKFRQRWGKILPNSWTMHLFESIGMPVFSATHSLKMEETRALSKPVLSNSEWVCPLHRLKFSGKRTQTRPAFRKEKTRAWRRLPIALLRTAYTVCRSLSIRTMPLKVVVPPWILSF